jgi:hypothetical protein
MRNGKETPPIRTDERFFKELSNIQLSRVNLGKEKITKPMPMSKITLAITRHKFFPFIKEDIIKEFKS